jgi:DNA-binding MarR family transcriptional regulator
MTITKLWRDRGLVSKTISPENQRITMVELTDKGRKELQTIFDQRNHRLKTLFNSINTTDQEKQVLINICQRGVKFLDQFLSSRELSGK